MATSPGQAGRKWGNLLNEPDLLVEGLASPTCGTRSVAPEAAGPADV
jgi:hypothetical protein